MDKGEVTAQALHDLSSLEYSFKHVSLELLKNIFFFKTAILIKKKSGGLNFFKQERLFYYLKYVR